MSIRRNIEVKIEILDITGQPLTEKVVEQMVKEAIFKNYWFHVNSWRVTYEQHDGE